MPDERKLDLYGHSAAFALAIARYIDGLIEHVLADGDVRPVSWFFLQVLLATYLMHVSVVRAINTLEDELGPDDEDS